MEYSTAAEEYWAGWKEAQIRAERTQQSVAGCKETVEYTPGVRAESDATENLNLVAEYSCNVVVGSLDSSGLAFDSAIAFDLVAVAAYC